MLRLRSFAMPIQITPERFAAGMTFDEYLAYIGSPENLRREPNGGGQRQDATAQFRAIYEGFKLSEDQVEALGWLVEQPNGPARMLAISEDWSSDCQRDIPT